MSGAGTINYFVMQENILINDRISLTAFQPSDKENLLLYMNDPVLHDFTLRVPHPYTEQDADAWLAKMQQHIEEYGAIVNWAIRDREAGVIGGIGAFLKTGMDGHNDEIGYWLAAPFRGKGIMTEVVTRYSEYLFTERPSLARLEAWVLPRNPASARVLEKAGYEREGYCRKMFLKNGEYRDAILLARIKD